MFFRQWLVKLYYYKCLVIMYFTNTNVLTIRECLDLSQALIIGWTIRLLDDLLDLFFLSYKISFDFEN